MRAGRLRGATGGGVRYPRPPVPPDTKRRAGGVRRRRRPALCGAAQDVLLVSESLVARLHSARVCPRPARPPFDSDVSPACLPACLPAFLPAAQRAEHGLCRPAGCFSRRCPPRGTSTEQQDVSDPRARVAKSGPLLNTCRSDSDVDRLSDSDVAGPTRMSFVRVRTPSRARRPERHPSRLNPATSHGTAIATRGRCGRGAASEKGAPRPRRKARRAARRPPAARTFPAGLPSVASGARGRQLTGTRSGRAVRLKRAAGPRMQRSRHESADSEARRVTNPRQHESAAARRIRITARYWPLRVGPPIPFPRPAHCTESSALGLDTPARLPPTRKIPDVETSQI